MPRPRQLEKIPTVVWRAFDKVIEEGQPLQITCSEERLARRYESRFREFQSSVKYFNHPNWREYHALQIIRRGSTVIIRHTDQDPDLQELEDALGTDGPQAEKGESPLRVDLSDPSSPSSKGSSDPEGLIDSLYSRK